MACPSRYEKFTIWRFQLNYVPLCLDYQHIIIMAKYNVKELKELEAAYRSTVSPQKMDELQEQIMNIVVMQKKYRDKDYSARKLANDLGTNTRYIAAVVTTRFHMNYSQFVNKHRIDEAMSILTDKRYLKLTMDEVSDMVGFANRQSFYASFYRFTGITPRQYRLNMMKAHPTMFGKKIA